MVGPVNNGLSENILRTIGNNRNEVRSSITRIASGNRLTSAGDDPAASAISARLQSQIATLGQATRNARDGSAAIRTAEGGLSAISDLVGRGRELAVQAANGTLDSDQRQAVSNELRSIASEIDRIGQTTRFNGRNLLDGSLAPDSPERLDIQVGENSDSSSRLNLNVIPDTGSSALELDDLDVSTPQAALDAVDRFDRAETTVASIRGEIGASARRLDSAARGLSQRLEGLAQSQTELAGTDLAGEITNLRQNLAQTQTSIRALALVNEQRGQLGKLLDTTG